MGTIDKYLWELGEYQGVTSISITLAPQNPEIIVFGHDWHRHFEYTDDLKNDLRKVLYRVTEEQTNNQNNKE